MTTTLVTAEQLAQELNLPSARFAKDLARRRKIPSVRLGHRTIRYPLEKVRAALEKLEVHTA